MGSLTAYLQGSFQFQQDWLVEENISGLQAEVPNLILRQVDSLDGSRTAHWKGRGR